MKLKLWIALSVCYVASAFAQVSSHIAPLGSGVGKNSRQIILTSNIPYREGNSQAWMLDLAEPVNYGSKELRSAIIIIHGGGWNMGYKHHAVYRDLMIDYAAQGYVTLSVEYRFNKESAFPACIEDVKCAVRWLKAHAKELRVDPERIGCYGHSAGAHLALMIGVSSDAPELEGDGPWKEYSSRVACVAAGAPPTEIGNPKSPWSQHPEWWPIGHISANSSPLLLLQGIEDPVVKVNLTDSFVEKMQKAGADIEYIKVHGQHNVAYDFALNVTKPAMDAFFAKHLQPGSTGVIKKKIIDEGGTGLYKAVACVEKSLPDYVVYRPADLVFAAEKEGKLPVLVFANGGCSDTSITHEKMLSEVASHGYVVIAIGSMQMDIKDREHKSTPSSMLTDAINWIEKESRNADSEYFNRVDINKIAAGGQSCGGAQALSVASDPRIKNYMMFNSGMGDMEMAGASKKSLKNLHAPIIYIIGGPSDIAYENAQKDYERISKKIPVAFADLTEGGHMGTFPQIFGGSFSKMALAWLDWQLKGKDYSAIFLQSELSGFPGWTMKTKNFQ